jgi:hypothetical protein
MLIGLVIVSGAVLAMGVTAISAREFWVATVHDPLF